MKSVLRIFIIGAILLPFAGCYTEMVTSDNGSSEYAYDSDTLTEEGNTTINNHYYLDDEYRRSRLRVSFHYYYPSYSSWISSYYHSYFNDYYWGMHHRPIWYHDPLLTYYPPYGWPYPYYDPWYPYYPPIAYYPIYYPVYYPTTTGSYPPPNDERRRNGGATDFNGSSDGTRNPIPGNPSPLPVTVATENPRPVIDNEARNPDTKKNTEVPWWDRLNTDTPKNNPNPEARPIETTKPVRPPKGNDPNPPTGGTERPNSGGEDRPINRPKNNPPVYTPPPRDDRPIDRPKPPKNDEPVYTPPSKKPSTDNDARPVERPRETRQPSYSPPPQSAPPQSTPPRSSGGGSSSGGNGRKRD